MVISSCESGTEREPVPPPRETRGDPPASLPSRGNPAIRVSTPKAEQVVTSPLTVSGEARGPWYFEASFPVKLVDASGQVLATAPAQAKGEWMTPEFVPFEATLTFSTAARSGVLVLEKSNASGLPEHADSITVPVRF
jgi:hypothetical protein